MSSMPNHKPRSLRPPGTVEILKDGTKRTFGPIRTEVKTVGDQFVIDHYQEYTDSVTIVCARITQEAGE